MVRNELLEETNTHEEWLDEVESVLNRLKLVDNPPVITGLTHAQILMGLGSDIEVQTRAVRQRLDEVEISLDDATIPVTRARMNQLREILVEEFGKAEGSVTGLYDQKVEDDPTMYKPPSLPRESLSPASSRRSTP